MILVILHLLRNQYKCGSNHDVFSSYRVQHSMSTVQTLVMKGSKQSNVPAARLLPLRDLYAQDFRNHARQQTCINAVITFHGKVDETSGGNFPVVC